jgi:dihydroorotase
MVYDLLVHNARIVTPHGTITGAVLVDNEHVRAVITGADLPIAREMVDAAGNFLVPGVVDIHVHFREPGQEYKAGYASESAAAAVGGVTTICDMPNNGTQAVVRPERVTAKASAASRSALVDFGIYAYLINSSLEAKRALQEAGVIGLKWDMSLAGTEPCPGAWLPTVEEALEGFHHAATLGLTIGIHAEDRASVARGVAALQAAGRTDAAAHLATRPAEVEALALRQALDLVRASGARLHVHHLSSALGLQLVRDAKREGLPVTAETIPPFLFLDSSDYERLGTVMKIHPAVKEPSDRAALWEGVLDGSIDCIATDHAPHTAAEKLRGVWEASPGAIGVQTSLTLMLTEVTAGRLTLEHCVALMSANPARIHGLYPRKGAIVPGADADLVLLDLNRAAIIANEAMLSPNHLTPFHGRETRGVPYRTWLRGHLTASGGVSANQAFGRQVRPGTGDITAPQPWPGTE